MNQIETGPNIERFAQLLKLQRKTSIVDIGANPIDGDPPYKSLLGSGVAQLLGFEPQEDALAVLNQRKGEHEQYLSAAIGDGEVHTLYSTAAPGMTSLLRPAPEHLEVFTNFGTFGAIRQELAVKTTRLDDLAEAQGADFIKIDIQGFELRAFQNAREILRHVSVIQTEVAFRPLYENQPLFSEIELELRAAGFVPHTLIDLRTSPIKPASFNNDPYQGLNQIREADCVFVKDFGKLDVLTNEQLKHYAMVIHSCYGSYDLVHHLLRELSSRRALDERVLGRYMALLSED